ncbi:hypothetical protein PanWU01x14_016410 [Parasponia andersonii]|uniref:Uncharacterized protein n=1 Tax=Parasponia andersonii TaxID=3476 RepID=A0A2P5DZK9_PARAD|nr:hypothetical protein PanWU01x14_016410 [Parasponia andersonii]
MSRKSEHRDGFESGVIYQKIHGYDFGTGEWIPCHALSTE